MTSPIFSLVVQAGVCLKAKEHIGSSQVTGDSSYTLKYSKDLVRVVKTTTN